MRRNETANNASTGRERRKDGTALLLYLGRHANALVLSSLAGAAIVALVGIIAILVLDWALMNMVVPIILVLAEIGLLFGLGRRSSE